MLESLMWLIQIQIIWLKKKMTGKNNFRVKNKTSLVLTWFSSGSKKPH